MKKRKTSKKWLLPLGCWLMGLSTTAMGADFVDDINATTNCYGYGHRVIYELNVGEFSPEGTFNAAAARLEGLKTLGIDVVWLMPIYPRDEKSVEGAINSPYAAVDFKATRPQYGTIADLKALVSKAHALNMEVWLDWVPNHNSLINVWVKEHPEYYKKDHKGEWIHPGSPPYLYSDVWQLDYENPELVLAMDDALKFWIDQADIDGYRCDFISSRDIPAVYWMWQIPRLREYAKAKGKETFTMLGEANFMDRSGRRLFGTGWDYDYAWELQEPILRDIAGGSDAKKLKSDLTRMIGYKEYSNLDRMVYLTNHDANYNHKKTLEGWYGDNRYAFQVLVFTLYGMPLLYNGDEIGGMQLLDYYDEWKVEWDKVDRKMLNTVRTLTALKHSVEAVQDGKTFEERGIVEWVDTDNDAVLAYKRKHGDSEALVVLNLGKAAKVKLTGLTAGNYTQWLDSKTIAKGVSRKATKLKEVQTLKLDAHGYAVFVKK